MNILRRLIEPDGACHIERPLLTTSKADIVSPFLFDREGPLALSCKRWSSWTQLFTQRLWTLGYQEQALARIFDSLPKDFCAIIQAASERVWLVMQRSAIRRASALAIEARAKSDGEESTHSFLECLEDIWERDGDEGFIEFAFDPATQQRKNVILNTRTATLAGMHKEEVLLFFANSQSVGNSVVWGLCRFSHGSQRTTPRLRRCRSTSSAPCCTNPCGPPCPPARPPRGSTLT